MEFARPLVDDLFDIVRSKSGDLRAVPFGRLLMAMRIHRCTRIVELRRGNLRKRILFENGVPVECHSNVLHDTFSHYLRQSGKLSADLNDLCRDEALERGVPIGQVLIERELLTSGQILALLQKLLAKVLLDVFAWEDGGYLVLDEPVDVKTPLKTRVDQLVLTGVTRFTPQARIDLAIAHVGPLPLRVVPGLAGRPDNPRFSECDRAVLTALAREPLTLVELRTLLAVDRTTIDRSVYTLMLLGFIDLSERVESGVARVIDEATVDEPTLHRVANEMTDEELSRLYLDHRRMSPAELLGLDGVASVEATQVAYLERCRQVGALAFRGTEGRATEQATEILLALALAYADLVRDAGVDEAEAEPTEAQPTTAPERPVLLDPTVHYSQGVDLMRSHEYDRALSDLETASDSDPQRGLYRAQAAYCLFLASKDNAEQALERLTDTHRIDPSCGLAFLYAGEVLMHLERFDEAQERLREASKLMAPDRRPIDKLRELRQLQRALS